MSKTATKQLDAPFFQQGNKNGGYTVPCITKQIESLVLNNRKSSKRRLMTDVTLRLSNHNKWYQGRPQPYISLRPPSIRLNNKESMKPRDGLKIKSRSFTTLRSSNQTQQRKFSWPSPNPNPKRFNRLIFFL